MLENVEQLNINLLLVDDNTDFLNVMSMLLRKKGFTVSTCPNSFDIWKCIDDHFPDLILLDYRMPRINGEQLCMAIKNKDETSKVPVVMLSSVPNIAEIAARCNADGFVGKNENTFYLKNYILRTLNTDQVRRNLTQGRQQTG